MGQGMSGSGGCVLYDMLGTGEDDGCQTVSPRVSDNTIHSGHFMVSNLNDDDLDDAEEPDDEEVAAADSPSGRVETPEDTLLMGRITGWEYDFKNASKQPRDTYVFGANQIAIDGTLTEMFNHMKLAYRLLLIGLEVL